MQMSDTRVVVIGAGVGGLVAAALLAARGCDVTVVETATGPGGKLRVLDVDGVAIDAGPTVFTLRGVFEEVFAACGDSLADHLVTRPAATLARHAWGTSRLDLFADPAASEAAIGDFAGADDARGYRAFRKEAARIFDALDPPFLRQMRINPLGLGWRMGLAGLGDYATLRPYSSLWRALGGYFRDPRLRQLFGRYATYCGSSPFRSPATLMLIAHVEAAGVWLIDGGMHALARALEQLAVRQGVRFRYGETVPPRSAPAVSGPLPRGQSGGYHCAAVRSARWYGSPRPAPKASRWRATMSSSRPTMWRSSLRSPPADSPTRPASISARRIAAMMAARGTTTSASRSSSTHRRPAMAPPFPPWRSTDALRRCAPRFCGRDFRSSCRRHRPGC
jgi:hypothetical protein